MKHPSYGGQLIGLKIRTPHADVNHFDPAESAQIVGLISGPRNRQFVGKGCIHQNTNDENV
jgi:hypothetical protein